MNNIVVRKYLGDSISFKVVNGLVYADATSMCKPFRKLFADWKRLKQTEEMINEVSEAMGIPIGKLVKVENGVGSWIHEELLLELAGWLNVKFRRWCQQQITTLIREGEVSIKKDSYQIEDPIQRAKKWIEEQEEKILLENKIAEDKPFVDVAKKRICQMDSLSLTDVTKSLGLKKGRITRWAKECGYLHKTKLEVNIAGEEYFTVYVSNGFKTIGINEAGLKLINTNLDEIK